MIPCPLCSAAETTPRATIRARAYLRCSTCGLIFVHPGHRLTVEEEAKRYRLHNNSADARGYTDFLRRLADQVTARLPRGSTGLDFGCGPTPVMAMLLNSDGYPTKSYDPIFFPDRDVLRATYDFVTCSEVVEHTSAPDRVFVQLGDLVRNGGVIAVMTQMYDKVADFETWWYVRDPTHVSFFCMDTMRWIAHHFNWVLSQPAENVVLFTRKDDR